MAFRRGLAPILIALVVALVYWPGLGGFWTRDDYMQLAFARLVGSSWPVFAWRTAVLGTEIGRASCRERV